MSNNSLASTSTLVKKSLKSWTSLYLPQGRSQEFCSGGPVTEVVRFQTLAISRKDHFDVTGQCLF